MKRNRGCDNLQDLLKQELTKLQDAKQHAKRYKVIDRLQVCSRTKSAGTGTSVCPAKRATRALSISECGTSQSRWVGTSPVSTPPCTKQSEHFVHVPHRSEPRKQWASNSSRVCSRPSSCPPACCRRPATAARPERQAVDRQAPPINRGRIHHPSGLYVLATISSA
jgi:hypothetical protein